jgi:HAD superfamily hydrolase (TIGR01509 family)
VLQAVVFDFDGLILDTETPEMRSWEAVFRHYGAEYPEWYWRFALGRGAEQVEKEPYDLLGEQGVTADRQEVLNRRAEILAGMLLELEILPGVVDRLDEAESLGLKIGLASSSKHEWVDGHLRRLGLFERFNRITCADEVARAKPFPDLYLRCCELLGAEPSDSVAFEDSVNGCLAARAAGMYVVAVPTHLTVREDLAADEIVDSLADYQLKSL